MTKVSDTFCLRIIISFRELINRTKFAAEKEHFRAAIVILSIIDQSILSTNFFRRTYQMCAKKRRTSVYKKRLKAIHS